ncbi:MAG: hypothetical protein JXA82_18185 [Sedimentisphaerales bacterium]|nr:hypothetical protein [Sedimentisphaerales bacterium]
MKRRVMLVTVMIGAFALVGCEDSQARIEAYKKALGQAIQISAQAQQFLDKAEPLIAQAQAAVDAGLISQEKLDKIVTETQKAVEVKLQADQRAQVLQGRIEEVLAKGEVSWADELELLGNAAQQVGPMVPGPYGAYITIGGGILAAVASFIAGSKKQAQQTNQVKSVLVDTVKSVDKALESLPDTAGAIKAALADHQTAATRQVIATIKEPSLP